MKLIRKCRNWRKGGYQLKVISKGNIENNWEDEGLRYVDGREKEDEKGRCKYSVEDEGYVDRGANKRIQ